MTHFKRMSHLTPTTANVKNISNFDQKKVHHLKYLAEFYDFLNFESHHKFTDRLLLLIKNHSSETGKFRKIPVNSLPKKKL